MQTPELEAALQLRTGEDAIAFFARYGNSTPLKFVYCNRSDQVRWPRRYNLTGPCLTAGVRARSGAGATVR